QFPLLSHSASRLGICVSPLCLPTIPSSISSREHSAMHLRSALTVLLLASLSPAAADADADATPTAAAPAAAAAAAEAHVPLDLAALVDDDSCYLAWVRISGARPRPAGELAAFLATWTPAHWATAPARERPDEKCAAMSAALPPALVPAAAAVEAAWAAYRAARAPDVAAIAAACQPLVAAPVAARLAVASELYLGPTGSPCFGPAATAAEAAVVVGGAEGGAEGSAAPTGPGELR
ncbi:hypothetical protein GGS23DRAFT_618161, partial [Durotheca rogersii]|uniref:uncharacterized protein n=1 Tax=Durotheca rogersii TaxID=419775 RepID=UPI00221FE2CA